MACQKQRMKQPILSVLQRLTYAVTLSWKESRVSASKSSQICCKVELDSATLSIINNHRSLPDFF